MSGHDFPSFGGPDSLREMRERMNRDREAFFGDDLGGGPRRPVWHDGPGLFRVRLETSFRACPTILASADRLSRWSHPVASFLSVFVTWASKSILSSTRLETIFDTFLFTTFFFWCVWIIKDCERSSCCSRCEWARVRLEGIGKKWVWKFAWELKSWDGWWCHPTLPRPRSNLLEVRFHFVLERLAVNSSFAFTEHCQSPTKLRLDLLLFGIESKQNFGKWLLFLFLDLNQDIPDVCKLSLLSHSIENRVAFFQSSWDFSLWH